MRPTKEFDARTAEKLYKKGFTDVEIAYEMNVSYHQVFGWRREADLPRNKNAPLLMTASKFQMAIDSGKSEKTVCESMGLSRHKLSKIKKVLKSGTVGKAIRLIQAGVSDIDVSKNVMVSRQRVHQIRKAVGAPPKRDTEKEERLERLKELYLKGMTDNLIAEKLGIRVETVGLYRRQHLGLPALIHHGQREETTKNMAKIASLSMENFSDKQIAAKIGISQAHVTELRIKLGIPSQRAKNLASLKGVVK